jgi:hypothetical protein
MAEPTQTTPIMANANDVLDSFDGILEQEVQAAERDPNNLKEDVLATVYDLRDQLENQRKELENEDLRQNIQFRREWTPKIFDLIVKWLKFIGVLVVLNGLNNCYIPVFIPIPPIFIEGPKLGWHLSDSVMIAVLGTTTITVVGLFGTVTGHFFNRSPSRIKKEEKREDSDKD